MNFCKGLSVIVLLLFLSVGCGSDDSDYADTGRGGPESTPTDIEILSPPENSNDLQDTTTADENDDELFPIEEGSDESTGDESSDGTEAADDSSDDSSGEEPTDGAEVADESTGDDSAEGGEATGDSSDDSSDGEETTDGTEVADASTGDESSEGTETESDSSDDSSDDEETTDETEIADSDQESDKETTETDTAPSEVPEPVVALDASQGKWMQSPRVRLVDNETYSTQIAKIKEYRVKIKDLKTQKKEPNVDIKAIKADILRYKDLINEARDVIGYAKWQTGIHTYWANKDLILHVKDNQKAGWYRIIMLAKNIGHIPDSYTHFNITVRNENSDKQVGGMNIKASEKIYNRGTMLVYLDEGDTDLNLLWTNDYYKKDEYDANIQIKKVRLKYAKAYNKSKRSLVRNANQYSYVDGRWFWDENSVRTYWSEQIIGFHFPNLNPGKYKVVILAKNYGKLPSDYSHFMVDIEADGVAETVSIPANENKYKRGNAVLDLTGGDTDLTLIWTNDQWKENEYDANIQIKKIRLNRIGDSERSALAAYLMATAKGNSHLIFGALLIVIIALGGIFIWNRHAVRE